MNRLLVKYIFKMQIKFFCALSVFVFGLISLFDLVEIARKYSISDYQQLLFAVKLIFTHGPLIFCEITGYVYFVAATACLWNLCQSQQIVVLKSFGKSPQQILYPFIACAAMIAVCWLFILHPIGQQCQMRYTAYVRQSNLVQTKNIWLDYDDRNTLVFIKNIRDNGVDGLAIYDLRNNKRIFAEHGHVLKDNIELEDVRIFYNDKIEHLRSYRPNFNLSRQLVELLSKPPYMHNIWSLYKIYAIQVENNVSLKKYEIMFHKLIANCFCFVVFALMAAVICFPMNRYNSKTDVAIKMIGSTMLIRFCNGLCESMAYSGVLSVAFAMWSVLTIVACIALAILIWREM